MKISIIGLGWFGRALAQELKEQHQIVGTSRSPEDIQDVVCEFLDADSTPSMNLMQTDVVVLNIPPFKDQLEWFKSWKWNPQTHVIFISSTSVYGDANQTIDESFAPDPATENGKVLVTIENWIKTFPHYAIIRFGGLIGGSRHPGKSLSGKKNLKAGNHVVNLIHQEDAVGFTKLVIEKKLDREIYNLVSPEHPSRKEYYEAYCAHHHLPMPEFEKEDSEGKTISSKKVSALYQFKKKI